jgi:hypothetical protein
MGRKTDGQKDRWAERQMGRKTDKNRWAERQNARKTDIQIYSQAYRETDK